MVAPGAVTSSVEPAGRSATIRASSESIEASTEDRSAYPRFPRSTTVSGQRASTAVLSPAAEGRYEATCPLRSASASAAPGPMAVAQPGVCCASRPQLGLLWNWLL